MVVSSYVRPTPPTLTTNSLPGRNTTLPHPEAKVSPDACITEEDVNPARALLRYRMSFMSQQESDSRSSTLQSLGLSSGEGTFSAIGRMAINSIRAAELPGLDALLNKDGDSSESSDGSSRDPDSPLHSGAEFGLPKADPRDAVRDPRERRRRRGSSFMRRLVHR